MHGAPGPQREIGREGAVLVRPDRYIGFRSKGGVKRHKDVLDRTPRQILHVNERRL
jgi:2,4-dichlorophenol 6-monooxygenase